MKKAVLNLRKQGTVLWLCLLMFVLTGSAFAFDPGEMGMGTNEDGDHNYEQYFDEIYIIPSETVTIWENGVDELPINTTWNLDNDPTFIYSSNFDAVKVEPVSNGNTEGSLAERLASVKVTGVTAGDAYVIMAPYTRVIHVEFADVRNTDMPYYYKAVYWAMDKTITKGFNENGTVVFGPDRNCTREQMVTFLWRMAGKPEPTIKSCPFNDVKKSEYYYKPVLWAYEKKIAKGYADGSFGVGKSVTRADALTFLYRVAGKPSAEKTASGFSDVVSGAYYERSVIWAAENGITKGYSDGTFGVEKDCLREHIVTFMYRYDNMIGKDKSGMLKKQIKVGEYERMGYMLIGYNSSYTEYDQNGRVIVSVGVNSNGYDDGASARRYAYEYDTKGNVTDEYCYNVGKLAYDREHYTETEYYHCEYAYDTKGRLIRMKDSNDLVTTYEYDKNDNIIKVAFSDGSFMLYEYDDNNNLIKETSDSGAYTVYSYDSLNRKINQVSYTSAGVVSYLEEYNVNGEVSASINYDDDGKLAYGYRNECDENGKVTKVTNYSNGIIYSVSEYNSDGNVSHVTEYNDDETVSMEYSYSYDFEGNLIKKTGTDYNQEQEINEVYREYYSDGKLKEIRTYFYDGKIDTCKEYNSDGNLIREKSYDYNGQCIYDRSNEYDEHGKLIKENVNDNGVLYSPQVKYEYDPYGRLGKKTTYDSEGNIVSTVTRSYGDSGEYIEKHYDSENNRTATFEYDKNGNITQKWNYTFKYDEEGNLIRITHLGKDGSTKHDIILEETLDKDGRILTSVDTPEIESEEKLDWYFMALWFYRAYAYEYDAKGNVSYQYTSDLVDCIVSETWYYYF